jgi:hypothetical protein
MDESSQSTQTHLVRGLGYYDCDKYNQARWPSPPGVCYRKCVTSCVCVLHSLDLLSPDLASQKVDIVPVVIYVLHRAATKRPNPSPTLHPTSILGYSA